MEHKPLRTLFVNLVEHHLDLTWPNARLDFLACSVAQNSDGALIAQEISDTVKVSNNAINVTDATLGVELTHVSRTGNVHKRCV